MKSQKPIPKGIQIIDEAKDYIVVDKPAGLVVHKPRESYAKKTLADWLVSTYPEMSKVGDDPMRPGIVQRLDALVSGVMVVA